MALFRLQCSCGHTYRRILDKFAEDIRCPKCGNLNVKRKPAGPSASVYETLDNGLQAKATVRPADAERIFKEAEIQADLDNPRSPDEEDLESIDTDGDFL